MSSECVKPKIAIHGHEIAREVAQERFNALSKTNEILDRRAIQLTSLSTAIGAVAGSAKLLPDGFKFDGPSILVLALVLCSIRVIAWTIQQLTPKERKNPGRSTVDDYYTSFIARKANEEAGNDSGNMIAREPDESINELISQLCICIESEEGINADKSECVDHILYWLKIQVWLLATAVGWPIIGPVIAAMLHGMFPPPLPW